MKKQDNTLLLININKYKFEAKFNNYDNLNNFRMYNNYNKNNINSDVAKNGYDTIYQKFNIVEKDTYDDRFNTIINN